MLEPKYFIPLLFVLDILLHLGATTSTTTTVTGENYSFILYKQTSNKNYDCLDTASLFSKKYCGNHVLETT